MIQLSDVCQAGKLSRSVPKLTLNPPRKPPDRRKPTTTPSLRARCCIKPSAWNPSGSCNGGPDGRVKQSDAWERLYWVMRISPEASYWLCISANTGRKPSQKQLAYLHLKGLEYFPQDDVKAYIWYSLAGPDKSPYASEHYALRNRDALAERMTPAQIAEAERLVQEWQPNLAECKALPEN